MSRLQARVNEAHVRLAAREIVTDMDTYLATIRMFVSSMGRLSDEEMVRAVREACDVWLSMREKVK